MNAYTHTQTLQIHMPCIIVSLMVMCCCASNVELIQVDICTCSSSSVSHELSDIGTSNELLMEQIWWVFKQTRSFVQNGP